MGKRGLSRRAAAAPDPTYAAVLGRLKKEARQQEKAAKETNAKEKAAKRKERAAIGFTCIKAVRFYLRANGYELAEDLVIRDKYGGTLLRSAVPDKAVTPKPKR